MSYQLNGVTHYLCRNCGDVTLTNAHMHCPRCGAINTGPLSDADRPGADIPATPGEPAGDTPGAATDPSGRYRRWADLTPDELDEALEDLERRGIHPLTLQAWLHAKSLPYEAKLRAKDEPDLEGWDVPAELADQRDNDSSDDEFVSSYYDEVEEAAQKMGLLPSNHLDPEGER
jgi:hypothetical protein